MTKEAIFLDRSLFKQRPPASKLVETGELRVENERCFMITAVAEQLSVLDIF